MRKFFFLVIISHFFIQVQAGIKNLKYFDPKFQYYEFKEACELLKKDSTLIEAKNQQYLDCMGEAVSGREFCLKKTEGQDNFVRAFIDKEERKVVCQFALRAELTFSCEREDKSYCSSPVTGCERLGQVFAAHKKIYHAGLIDEGLKCYFE